MPVGNHASSLDPTPRQLYDLVAKVEEKVDKLDYRFQALTRAFPNDDLNFPDYDGHRKAHIKIQKDFEVLSEYKHEFTKKIVFAVLLYAAGLVSTFGLELLKVIGN
jgi:hypothetical protein